MTLTLSLKVLWFVISCSMLLLDIEHLSWICQCYCLHGGLSRNTCLGLNKMRINKRDLRKIPTQHCSLRYFILQSRSNKHLSHQTTSFNRKQTNMIISQFDMIIMYYDVILTYTDLKWRSN
jgi:hypothetical protein